ncbi:MAG: hypothetical protein JXB03_03030 [Spirochaetales bacterium]|nr:hypothetical protein [Spirochaetales bacterium]
MTDHIVKILEGTKVPFRNNVDYCIGTGRMGLALHKEYMAQLALVQDAIGFSYIRGHGLFSDDMALCRGYKDENGEPRIEYNFTYIDMVMDNYLALGIRPFLELGFMPSALASGEQTVFYWKGNVTPPRDYEQWKDLIKALLSHLIERYGREEVLTWPVEVWNEPNLAGFWKDADMDEYFRLYGHSAHAVKEVDERLRVGGPAICGVDDQRWLRMFLEYVRDHKLPLDFVTRHHYTIEPPRRAGHYAYAKLHDVEESFEVLEASRRIVDGYPEFAGMDIHITEFNTAYIPDCPLHDTNLNAAFIATLLSRLGDSHASYSYWTFGDVFEEKDVPFTPFHGGFGLVANGGIPKPTFWTFAFFKELEGACVHRDSRAIIVKTAAGAYRGVLWNADTAYTGESVTVSVELPGAEGEYFLVTRTVDEETCNPLKLWHDMGEPSHLMPGQLALLKEHARPLVTSKTLMSEDGELSFDLVLKPNAVVYFELSEVVRKSDRGYSYERVIQGEN